MTHSLTAARVAEPIDTVSDLVDAINRGDLDAAVALYEPSAVLVVQPGQVARGTEPIREALAAIIAIGGTIRSELQQVIQADDVAQYASRWSLHGTDPAGLPVVQGGESADVLRRGEDGRWRIALDNPWGARILS